MIMSKLFAKCMYGLTVTGWKYIDFMGKIIRSNEYANVNKWKKKSLTI